MHNWLLVHAIWVISMWTSWQLILIMAHFFFKLLTTAWIWNILPSSSPWLVTLSIIHIACTVLFLQDIITTHYSKLPELKFLSPFNFLSFCFIWKGYFNPKNYLRCRCLSYITTAVGTDPAHFDLSLAREKLLPSGHVNIGDWLVLHTQDLVALAYQVLNVVICIHFIYVHLDYSQLLLMMFMNLVFNR